MFCAAKIVQIMGINHISPELFSIINDFFSSFRDIIGCKSIHLKTVNTISRTSKLMLL